MLIGKCFSLAAVAFLFVICGVAFLTILAGEISRIRNRREQWSSGWNPFGSIGLMFALVWVAVVLVSLLDFQKGQNLYSSLFLWDHASRVNWTESILRTGIPPDNSLYFYQHSAPMRNYYFWYVLCAAVVKIFHLPARAVLIASCVWAGFALAAIIGLFLKHFLAAGSRLRRQFLLAVGLLCVTGLDICVNVIELFFLHHPLPLDLEWWSHDEIYSWYGSLIWVPHHVMALVCCMFAFLLAWLSASAPLRTRIVSTVFIAFALASAFGLSIFVPFGFFLVMLAWGTWQIIFIKTRGPALLLATGAAIALVLVVPFVRELTQATSKMQGGRLFTLSIREMIPSALLLGLSPFHSLSVTSPQLAQAGAKLLLLLPGYAIELGFFFIVFLIYLVPKFRNGKQLTSAERSLVFIAIATVPVISFLRSAVLQTNDFGWRAAMILQFPLLLLASGWLMNLKSADTGSAQQDHHASQRRIPVFASLALAVGVISTISQALLLRFDYPLLENAYRATKGWQPGTISHNAYISYLGYKLLDARIPKGAVVQFNPANGRSVWTSFDQVNVNHPIAIAYDQLWCGSELGGNPAGCAAMIAAIDPLYLDAPAEQAHTVCRKYGIQFLVAKVYDPVWRHGSSWVWNLASVVNEPEFRVLDCR